MSIYYSVKDWFINNYTWVITLFVQGFIAYHVLILSKKLTIKGHLEHKDNIKTKAEKLLGKMFSEKLKRKVYLVNVKRYFKDYPANEEKRFEGYSHIAAEIKSTRYDGIEFFAEIPKQVYKKENGKLTFKTVGNEKAFLAYPVGIVPYEWIEHIDPVGDEYGYFPLFFCHFKGKSNWRFWIRLLFFKYPYKQMVYYKKSNIYKEGNDPPDMEYLFIKEHISKR
jgi:hypothetical protein